MTVDIAQAFRDNYRRLRALAGKIVGYQDAEDMVQEAFIDALRALPNFRGECTVSSWLYRITLNNCFYLLRKQARNREDVVEDFPDPSTSTTPLDIARDAQMLIRANQMLGKLNSRYQKVLMMRWEGYTNPEIASLLNVSVATVKRAYKRGQEQLKRNA